VHFKSFLRDDDLVNEGLDDFPFRLGRNLDRNRNLSAHFGEQLIKLRFGRDFLEWIRLFKRADFGIESGIHTRERSHLRIERLGRYAGRKFADPPCEVIAGTRISLPLLQLLTTSPKHRGGGVVSS